MPEGLCLGLALSCSLFGAAVLALSMEAHWQQACASNGSPSRAVTIGLRAIGGAALIGSLLLCLRADHASMAVLVWIMSLAAASFIVALMLAWRPRWLAWLVAWMPRA